MELKQLQPLHMTTRAVLLYIVKLVQSAVLGSVMPSGEATKIVNNQKLKCKIKAQNLPGGALLYLAIFYADVVAAT